eukprot:1158396-Pelagomonas_calceolata.AAC.13
MLIVDVKASNDLFFSGKKRSKGQPKGPATCVWPSAKMSLLDQCEPSMISANSDAPCMCTRNSVLHRPRIKLAPAGPTPPAFLQMHAHTHIHTLTSTLGD